MLLSDLRTEARRRTDFENNPLVSDAELTSWANLAQKELYDLLIQQGDFAFSYYTFTSVARQSEYPLPEDFYRLVGVEIESPDSDVWITLRKYQYGERNRYTGLGAVSRPFLRYRLLGKNLSIEPPPEGGYRIRIAYHPRPAELADSVTIRKVASGGDVPTPNAATLNGVSFTVASRGTDLVGLRADILTLAADETSALFGVTAVLSETNTVLTLGHPRAFRLDISVLVPQLYASIWHWQNYVDGISGWEEYIILDCAARIVQKDNDDPSTFLAQKMAQGQRILEMSSHRDVSGPESATDTEGLCTIFQNPWFRGGY